MYNTVINTLREEYWDGGGCSEMGKETIITYNTAIIMLW